jgi:peptidoglycan pentaglycine glycine transferase (the first glycine)
VNPLETTWNEMISALPGAHFMQTTHWAAIKARTGWMPMYRVWNAKGSQKDSFEMFEWGAQPGISAAASLILQRTISLGGFSARLRILYVPKGPLLDWNNLSLRHQVLADIKSLAHQQGAIFVKTDPDVILAEGFPGSAEDQANQTGQSVIMELRDQGWHLSDEQVQFRNTILIDLHASPDDILARMKQKTRYNVRLAERKGVTVRTGNLDDLQLLYRMYAGTSIRDGFVIRPADYYLNTWQTFIQAGLAEALIAEVEGEPVAAIIIFNFAGKAWYVYGMSRELHRDKMPNHLLQWHAILHSQSKGCSSYDLWGAPDDFVETDPLWNVYRFKEGLGGRIVRHIGAWDLPTRPIIYSLYTKMLPQFLNILRQKGKADTQKTVGI